MVSISFSSHPIPGWSSHTHCEGGCVKSPCRGIGDGGVQGDQSLGSSVLMGEAGGVFSSWSSVNETQGLVEDVKLLTDM